MTPRYPNSLFVYDVNPADSWVEASWNMLAHAQKPDFVFRRNGRVHLNRMGLQFSRLLTAEVCASAVVMLDTPCSEVVWRVLAIHSIRQFPLHFPSRASPCAITFQLNCTKICCLFVMCIRQTTCHWFYSLFITCFQLAHGTQNCRPLMTFMNFTPRYPKASLVHEVYPVDNLGTQLCYS
jgi:hypothetical protein